MTHDTEKIQRVIDLYIDICADIETPLYKPWLKVAAVSHLMQLTGYPKEFISKIIEIIYMQEDI
jgi:hypothetical protein